MEIIKKYHPIFSAGSVLRAEQLQQLAMQAYTLPNLLFKNYSNGIITGCDVDVADNLLIISSGLFYFNGQVYVIEKNIDISYTYTNKWVYLKIKKIDNIAGNGENIDIFSIEIDENTTTRNEIELCRFKLQNGAKLRILYDDFEDMNTEFDTVNILHVPFSSENKSTLHPKILKRFAKELVELSPQNILDQVFCIQINNSSNSITLEGIKNYLNFRGNKNLDSVSNIEIYKELLNILKSGKNEEKYIDKKSSVKRKIIID